LSENATGFDTPQAAASNADAKLTAGVADFGDSSVSVAGGSVGPMGNTTAAPSDDSADPTTAPQAAPPAGTTGTNTSAPLNESQPSADSATIAPAPVSVGPVSPVAPAGIPSTAISPRASLHPATQTQETPAQPSAKPATPVASTAPNRKVTGIHRSQVVISSTIQSTAGADRVLSMEPPTPAYSAGVAVGTDAALSFTVHGEIGSQK
jgi:hypothetical protein